MRPENGRYDLSVDDLRLLVLRRNIGTQNRREFCLDSVRVPVNHHDMSHVQAIRDTHPTFCQINKALATPRASRKPNIQVHERASYRRVLSHTNTQALLTSTFIGARQIASGAGARVLHSLNRYPIINYQSTYHPFEGWSTRYQRRLLANLHCQISMMFKPNIMLTLRAVLAAA